MKSKNKILLFKPFIVILFISFAPLNCISQVKFYNNIFKRVNIEINKYGKYFLWDTLNIINFNTKPPSNEKYYIKIDDTLKNYITSLFCDSTGTPMLTNFKKTYFDNNYNKIPINFSNKENEIGYNIFFTNKSKYIFSYFKSGYQPPNVAYNLYDYFYFVRFNKNNKFVDTSLFYFEGDKMLFNYLGILYSSNCDFNYLYCCIKNRFYGKRVGVYFKIDSVLHKDYKILHSMENGELIRYISPKGDVAVIVSSNQANTLSFHRFNNQKVELDLKNPFLNLKSCGQLPFHFSVDGQCFFTIYNDSVFQFSLKSFNSNEILKSKKFIGYIDIMTKKYDCNNAIMTIMPDENIYFKNANYTNTYYYIKRISNLVYKLDSISNVDFYFPWWDNFTYSTALYHPHFTIETKEILCKDEEFKLITNHIDSFANYHWQIKDEQGNTILNSYKISFDYEISKPGKYFISLIYRWRCNSIDSVFKEIIVKKDEVFTKIKDSVICFNGKFTAKVPSVFSNINWSNGIIGNYFETNTEGKYYVTYTDRCKLFKDSFSVDVIKELAPQMLDTLVVLCEDNEAYETKLKLPDNIEYNWSDGFQNLNRVINKESKYSITYKNNCQILKESLNVIYSEKNTNLFIPNAISPNSDGLNENWEINDISNIKQIQWKIFNKWGEKVDEGCRSYFDFNELVKFDNKSSGVYFYDITVSFQCNSITKRYKGLIHLYY